MVIVNQILYKATHKSSAPSLLLVFYLINGILFQLIQIKLRQKASLL